MAVFRCDGRWLKRSEALNLEFPDTSLAVIVDKAACALLFCHRPDLLLVFEYLLGADHTPRREAFIPRLSELD